MSKKHRTKDDVKIEKYAHDLIRGALKGSGMKQKDLVDIVDRDPSEITRCLSDDKTEAGTDFSLAEYVKIADCFGISLNDLFGIPNPVETASPETARDACKMLVDLYESEYHFFFRRNENGYIYLYYPEIYPEDKMKAKDPAALSISPNYEQRHEIHVFLDKWNDLIDQLYNEDPISMDQYKQILEEYLKDVSNERPKDDFDKFPR